ncbi:hypothetical protein R1flu_015485 [Riccia fluitans]|uniref:RING-type domain-containing protein n=1 Tax=Riccia fluitans TaxID=41844 RepID=A0ABD1YJ43_9MARC
MGGANSICKSTEVLDQIYSMTDPATYTSFPSVPERSPEARYGPNQYRTEDPSVPTGERTRLGSLLEELYIATSMPRASIETSDVHQLQSSEADPSVTSSSQGPRMTLISLLLRDDEDPGLNRRGLSSSVRADSSRFAGELREPQETADDGMDPAVCCVCMEGRKGAAIIPCGHTFCRTCAWEVWNKRGVCPLCNIKIHSVLKIY